MHEIALKCSRTVCGGVVTEPGSADDSGPIMARAIEHSELLLAASQLKMLPSPVTRLAQLASSGDWRAEEAEEIIITLDPALATRVLLRANSTRASAVEIVRIRDAIVQVGMGPVLWLVTGHHVRQTVEPAVFEYGLAKGALWRHSVASALAVEVLSSVCATPPPLESFVAALLHDIGKLIMFPFLDSSLLILMAEASQRDHLSSVDAETVVLGVHHGKAGALVAEHWTLPPRIITGIRYHHAPDRGNDPVCDIVHVANILAKRVGTGCIGVAEDDRLHLPAFERLGITTSALETCQEKLAAWLALCANIVETPSYPFISEQGGKDDSLCW